MNRLLATATLLIGLVGPLAAQTTALSIPTRFGELQTNGDAELQYKGQVIPPGILVPERSSIVATYKLASSDVLLIKQVTGGEGCPGLYVFVTVSASGAVSTPEFGTCAAEAIHPVQEGQTISFTMTSLEKHSAVRFTYDQGSLLEDGHTHK